MASREESKPEEIKIGISARGNSSTIPCTWVGAPARVLTSEEIGMIRRTAPSREKIASRAHELYRQRDGEQGNDVADWVRAETELKRLENEVSMQAITIVWERPSLPKDGPDLGTGMVRAPEYGDLMELDDASGGTDGTNQCGRS